MNLNIISRIASDKNFFFSYLEVVQLLKKNYNFLCKLNFIGPIESLSVYEEILQKSYDLGISTQINFTKKEVQIQQMENGEDDYYLNVCIGDFVGYSSIECIEKGFNTIFINIDECAEITNNFASFCKDALSFYKLLVSITEDAERIKSLLKADNQKFLKTYYLNEKEKETLRFILNN